MNKALKTLAALDMFSLGSTCGNTGMMRKLWSRFWGLPARQLGRRMSTGTNRGVIKALPPQNRFGGAGVSAAQVNKLVLPVLLQLWSAIGGFFMPKPYHWCLVCRHNQFAQTLKPV